MGEVPQEVRPGVCTIGKPQSGSDLGRSNCTLGAEGPERTLGRGYKLLKGIRERQPTPPSVCLLKLLVHSCVCSEAKSVPWGGWPVTFFAPECRAIWQLLESESAPSELLVFAKGKAPHPRILLGFSTCLRVHSESQVSISEDWWG